MARLAAAVRGGVGYTVVTHPTGQARSTLNEQSPQEAALRKRLYWHSRRGMWELDLLLVPFLEQRYDTLEPADQAAFRNLIDEEDQDLFMWLMRRELPAEPVRRRIVQMIIEHAESADSVSHRPV